MSQGGDSSSIDTSPKLSDIYRDAVATRNAELQALWNRFNLYLVLNSGFLAAYAAGAADHSLLKQYKFLGPIVGLALVAAWGSAERFGRWALGYRDRKVEELENLWPDELKKKIQLYRQMPWQFRRQQWLSAILIILFAVAWLKILCDVAHP